MSDTDELLRVIGGYCNAHAWDDLMELRIRCREAIGRGKQLWGVEEHIRYRLALEAPAAIAGPVVSEGQARFALGPLAEVAASTKTWPELSQYLAPGPDRRTVAAERVIRGDDVAEEIPDLPAVLMDWEPAYPIATYKADRVETPAPGWPLLAEVDLVDAPDVIEDPASEAALSDLVQPWVEESNGRCQTVTVSGNHLGAISALGLRVARTGLVSTKEALQWLGWVGASGGAHGRRRGAAAGRYLAWWVIAALADLDWPADPGEIGDAANGLKWHWFDDGSPDTGWNLRISVADPVGGLAWAVSASDSV